MLWVSYSKFWVQYERFPAGKYLFFLSYYVEKTVVSFAKKRIVDIFSDNSRIPFIHIKINKGESTEPCGSPMLMVYADENVELTCTLYLRSEINLFIKLITFPPIPYL